MFACFAKTLFSSARTTLDQGTEVLGVASLTLILAVLFLIEGVLDMIVFFQMRSTRGAFWVLVDGSVTLLLGLMICLQWPQVRSGR